MSMLNPELFKMEE